MILPTQDEFIIAKVYERMDNGFDYKKEPKCTFKCRIANNFEKKQYRIMKGVEGREESVYIYATNLPTTVKVSDKVELLGEVKIVKSIGYYFDDSMIVNPSLFSPEYIFENSPKGIALS